MATRRLLFPISTLCALAALALPLVAAAADTRVDLAPSGRVRDPVVAPDQAGWSLVAWASDKQGVMARRLDPTGRPASNEQTVAANLYPPRIPWEGIVKSQLQPALVFHGPARFFAFWTEETAFLRVDYFYENREVRGRAVWGVALDGRGRLAGTPFLVAPVSGAFQSAARAVRLADGRLLVAWQSESRGSGAPVDGVFARFLAADGRPLGGPFRLSSAAGAARNVALALGGDGRFVAAWDACCADGSGDGVFARAFASDGRPLAAEARVNVTTLGQQARPALLARAGGYFVAFQGRVDGVRRSRIFGRLLDAVGRPTGGEIAVSSGFGQAQVGAALAADGDGMVAAWVDWQEPFAIGVAAVRLDAQGRPASAEHWLNDGVIQSQKRLGLAGAPGRLQAVWEGFAGNRVAILAEPLDF